MQTFKHQKLFLYTKAHTRYFLLADFFLLINDSKNSAKNQIEE